MVDIKVNWCPPSLGQEERDALTRVYDSNWLGEGPETKKFEEELAEYIGSKEVICLNSGTAALQASLIAHGIGPGDEVIVPTYTFIATVNSVLSVGAKPVLVDCDPHTWNTTPEIVSEKITAKTKAMIPVDIAGMSVDIDSFVDLAADKNITLIQDSAQSLGGSYKSKKVGNFNHLSCFSFHMAKIMTTIEGGCISTNDSELATNLRAIRNHGMSKKYHYTHFGLNMRTTDLASGFGRAQLAKLDSFIKSRNTLAQTYMKELDCTFQEIPDYVTTHPWMLFGILHEHSEELRAFMKSKDIDCRNCWKPAHQQPYHSSVLDTSSYPNSDSIFKHIVNLPMGSGSTPEEIQHVINTLKDYETQ